MSHKECAQGHVIEDTRETCSRCNGPAVNHEIGDSVVEETAIVEEVQAETSEEVTTENPSAPVDETQTEQVQSEVEPTPESVSTTESATNDSTPEGESTN